MFFDFLVYRYSNLQDFLSITQNTNVIFKLMQINKSENGLVDVSAIGGVSSRYVERFVSVICLDLTTDHPFFIFFITRRLQSPLRLKRQFPFRTFTFEEHVLRYEFVSFKF